MNEWEYNEWEYHAAAAESFQKDADREQPGSEQRKNYLHLAKQARELRDEHKHKPPAPIVYSVHGGYVTAGPENKLRTFLMPSRANSEGFLYVWDIFLHGIDVHDIFDARYYVGECKQPANTFRNRVRACADVLETEDCRDVATLFRRISVSDNGLITFQKDRDIILPPW